MDFFSLQQEKNRKKTQPLAEKMRPESLDEMVGHENILGEGRNLRRLILADRIPSLLFYGPPGSGKTTLAQVIAQSTRRRFVKISAVSAGVKDLREVIGEANHFLGVENARTILFIDEIHRFNKAQQDYLLPFVEKGTITLIGATTENPYFEVNKALLSRMQVVELKRLTGEDLAHILGRALTDTEKGLGKERIHMPKEARETLIQLSSGDARVLLNALEIAFLSTPEEKNGITITRKAVEASAFQKIQSYDKGEEEHYNTISAFIKSVRGSDPDAAIYYLARMLKGGEDPAFIARRLVILASEDIGNANPMALVLANSCFEGVLKIGMPEARILLSQTTAYLAASPKSNASYLAIDRAMSYLNKDSADIPDHLKDTHYAGAKALHRGLTYKYPHDYEGGYVAQRYLPEEVEEVFYEPKPIGEEKELLEYLSKLNDK